MYDNKETTFVVSNWPTDRIGHAFREAILADDQDKVTLIIKDGVRHLILSNDTVSGLPLWDSALYFATEHGKLDTVRLLLAHAYGDTFSAAYMRARYRNVFNVANLISSSYTYRLTEGSNKEQDQIVKEISRALFPAAAFGNADIVRELLQDPRTNVDSCLDSAPLTVARFASPVYCALFKKNIDIIKLFLESGKYNIDKPVAYFVNQGWKIAIQIKTNEEIVALLADWHVKKMIKHTYDDEVESTPYLVEQLSEKRLALYYALRRYLDCCNDIEKISILQKILEPQHLLYQIFSGTSIMQMFSFLGGAETDFIQEIKTTLAGLTEVKANASVSSVIPGKCKVD